MRASSTISIFAMSGLLIVVCISIKNVSGSSRPRSLFCTNIKKCFAAKELQPQSLRDMLDFVLGGAVHFGYPAPGPIGL